MRKKDKYTVFKSDWWHQNDKGKWVPGGTGLRHKRSSIIASGLTLDEAVELCNDWNPENETFVEVEGVGMCRNIAAEIRAE